jgi:hypothetical protein
MLGWVRFFLRQECAACLFSWSRFSRQVESDWISDPHSVLVFGFLCLIWIAVVPERWPQSQFLMFGFLQLGHARCGSLTQVSLGDSLSFVLSDFVKIVCRWKLSVLESSDQKT